MYLVCMHVCCFCYMQSRFEKLCRACDLCMLWYVSTLNKTLFIYLFIIPHTWLVQLKCAVQKSLHNLQHDEGGNYMAETGMELYNSAISLVYNLCCRIIVTNYNSGKYWNILKFHISEFRSCSSTSCTSLSLCIVIFFRKCRFTKKKYKTNLQRSSYKMN